MILFHSQFISPRSPFIPSLHLVELQVLYWVDKDSMDSLALSLLLVNSLEVDLHFVWCWLLAWSILLSICWGICPLSMIFLIHFTWMDVGFISGFFSGQWDNHVFFFYQFIFVMYYGDTFFQPFLLDLDRWCLWYIPEVILQGFIECFLQN